MKKTQVAVAVATALAAGGVQAAAEWTLTGLATKSNNGTAAAALTGVTTFSTGVGNSLNADGSFSGATKVGMTPLFTWNFGSDFSISGAGASTGSFSCAEGFFGGIVGASICGNYTFGANGYNESSYDGSSGTAVIGGDDAASGAAQSIADFQSLSPAIPPTDFMTTIVLENGTAYSGVIFTFTANIAPVPVPAAAWLFGSALGLLGWVRRRATA